MTNEVTINGGCHCGAVSFIASVDKNVNTLICNCSICNANKYEHLFVKKEKFYLVSGKDKLTEYTFGTKTAIHFFCKVCGVKSFYLPRSHPDSYSVNLNCVTNKHDLSVTQDEFDGKNWDEAHGDMKKY